jgi:GT2 family glycosyltransferase
MIPPDVSFVVPTFRRPDALAPTLDALAKLDYPADRYEVIVVDNADDEATAWVVRSRPRVRYEVERKPGAAAARNRGARMAEGRLLIFCDDDILVEPDHVRLALQTHERSGDGLVNGHWHFSPQTIEALRRTPFGRYRLALEEHFRTASTGARQLNDGCWEMPAVSACNLAVSRERFWRLGGFDEEFPFAGAEDQEFSIRARAAGLRLIRNDKIALLHNDQTITFEQFCAREERSAQTAAVLATKQPGWGYGRAFLAVNGPLRRSDPPAVALKKLVKGWLALPLPLRLTHQAVRIAERARLPDRALARIYSGVVGVHILRGFRQVL